MVETPTGQHANIHALVVKKRPLGVDVLLGDAGISAFGGVVVRSSTKTHSGSR